MQFFTLAATAAFLAGTALAAPTKVDARDVTYVEVVFQGAADAQFVQWVAVDGAAHPVYDVLSISHIIVNGPTNVECTADGVDKSCTTVSGGEGPVDVGPPQTQNQVTCKWL